MDSVYLNSLLEKENTYFYIFKYKVQKIVESYLDLELYILYR